MSEKQKKIQVAKISVFITSIFAIFLSVTYAFINLTLQGTKKQVITAGTLELDLIEDENNITLTNALPMYDEVGMLQDAFTFRLKNKGTTDVNYTLKLVDITTGDKLQTSNVKYYLTKDGTGTPALLSTLTNGQVDSGTISGNQTIEYTLRLWIDDSVTDDSRISGKSLSYRVDVEANQKIECIEIAETAPNAPELTSGMIPVVYDESGKIWKKADVSSEWYDYSNQEWANAVTVTEATRAGYMSAATGTPIDIGDINTMWVWIPRYSYTIRDTYGVQLEGGSTPSQTTPGAIDIKFITKEEKDSGTGKCERCADNWVTPEGFTFGGENVPGFWMAKFETTGSMTPDMQACTDENCTAADLTVLPNKNPVVNQTVSSFFYASRSMQNSSNANKYGFNVAGEGTKMDVHMIKNTEWGIVAMLSQSKYGKYGNPNYEGANKEVAINNCSSYITGVGGDTISADPSSTTCTTNTYETEKGRTASTTGTIYGVYDMSGGVDENVMGNYNRKSGHSSSENSGFTGYNGPTTGGLSWPNDKYYDLYTPSENYKVGDAYRETWGWYSDYAFWWSDYPWFFRGGNYKNTFAGIFSFNGANGSSYTSASFRLAIKP